MCHNQLPGEQICRIITTRAALLLLLLLPVLTYGDLGSQHLAHIRPKVLRKSTKSRSHGITKKERILVLKEPKGLYVNWSLHMKDYQSKGAKTEYRIHRPYRFLYRLHSSKNKIECLQKCTLEELLATFLSLLCDKQGKHMVGFLKFPIVFHSSFHVVCSKELS